MERYVLKSETPWLDDAYLDFSTISLSDGTLTIKGYVEAGRIFKKMRIPICLTFEFVSGIRIDDSQELGGLTIDTIRHSAELPGFVLEGPIPGSLEISTSAETFIAERWET